MKAIWSGSISFGLVTIPIYLYAAIQEHTFGFHTLCGHCHNVLHYMRWCATCKKEIPWEDTVRGLEQPNKKMVVLTQKEIEALKPETSKTIAIREFIAASELRMLYIHNHYYVGPAKEDAPAFYLFLEALKKSNMVAIGQCIMHEKEHVIALRAHQDILLAHTLHYAYEIRDTSSLKPSKKLIINKKDLSLALELINHLTHKTFKLATYKETFIEDLKKRLKTGKKRTKKTHAKRIKKEAVTSSLKRSLKK